VGPRAVLDAVVKREILRTNIQIHKERDRMENARGKERISTKARKKQTNTAN
jgi:hypothetical protein